MVQGRYILTCLAVLSGLSAQANQKKKYNVDEQPPKAVPGEYVVKLKDTLSTENLSLHVLSARLGVRVLEKLSAQSNAVLVQRPVGELRNFAVETLTQNPAVEYAEPNYIYHVVGGAQALSMPNDPELHRLWGLINNGQRASGDMGDIMGVAGIDIDAKRAWEIETGNSSVFVASIDTGVDYRNPDLAPNMWVNEAELNGRPGTDDDGNGFVDDVYGYDFANNDGDPMDDQGHGSHTVGTIAGAGNNGIGIVGVAWQAKVMAVKFLSASGGGSLANAVKSIDYTTQMGVHLTNNSWGGGGFSQALYDSIARARDAGILFVAAAGNSGGNNDTLPEYPASYDLDNIVSVAAIDNQGELAYFSCFGRQSVDVGAPGVNVLSTSNKGLESMSGTSMAAPHVAGIAVLLKAANPSMSYSEIKDRIIATARPLPSLRGKVVSGGLANAYFALTNTVPPPDPNDPSNWEKFAVRVSTPHPYPNKYRNRWQVSVPGATKIAIHFSRFETEQGYDKVTIRDGQGRTVVVWSGNRSDSFSPVIEGSSAELTFESDDSVNGYGFDIEAIAYQ